MILIDDIKYSCIECIRGHRSSLCRHHTRPLLQVRSKGRPNVSANGNPNHRIAIFAEEIVHEEENSKGGCETNDPKEAKSSGGGKKCKSRASPVVILKSSPKQVIDLVSGQIIGAYEPNDEKDGVKSKRSPSLSQSQKYQQQESAQVKTEPSAETSVTGGCANCSNVKSESPSIPATSQFGSGNQIQTQTKASSSCCGSNSKATSKCACSNKYKTINKSKILKTYLQNHLMKSKDKSLAEKFIRKEEQDQHLQQQQLQQQQWQVLFPQNSGSNGSQAQQATQNGKSAAESFFASLSMFQSEHQATQSQAQPQQLQFDYSYPQVKQEQQSTKSIAELASAVGTSSLASGDHYNDVTQDATPPPAVPGVYDVVNIPACSIPGTCCCGDSCSCEGCVVHGNPLESISEQFDKLPPVHHQVVLSDNKNQPEAPYAFTELFDLKNLEGGIVSDDSPASNATCSCPNGECDCYNCESHGIINGTKLDDFFNAQRHQADLSLQQFQQQQQQLHQQPSQQSQFPQSLESSSQQASNTNQNFNFNFSNPDRDLLDYASLLNSVLSKESTQVDGSIGR